MPLTLQWIQDQYANRFPTQTPPLSASASANPNGAALSDVLRDRAAGIVRDPTRLNLSAMESMNSYMGLALTTSPAARNSTRRGGHRRAGSPAPASAQPKGKQINPVTWLVGLVAIVFALMWLGALKRVRA
jgi:hypothetical protein